MEGTAAEQEIVGFCRQRLSGYNVPRLLELRTELPVTTTRKMLRRKLR